MKHLLSLALLLAGVVTPVAAQSYRDRLPEDEVMYFLLPDRFENGDPANDTGGLTGDRLKTGFDPAHKGFFHGGDLKGLTRRLDYIQGMGVTAIWLGPIFKNKPVQGPQGQESAGYHGYWITDFTQVDPHFGTNADMKAFVDAAHARGIKVYMDIIVNHTADVIQYKECQTGPCGYRSRADYPYSRRTSDGAAINPGFAGEQTMTAANFAKLTDFNYAYTPYVPEAEKTVKVPAWLNDIRYYHNRGDSTFRGESSTMGDFVGLDDLMTEDPRVVAGFIDIFGGWIDRFGVDGFRIDTARHVNPQFWQAFTPAMLARAKAKGIPNFHIFGEVATGDMDVALLAQHTRVDKLPAVLDFAFRRAALDTVAGVQPTETWGTLFARDALYEGGETAARRLPTFVSNHDAGRFAFFARQANPRLDDATLLKMLRLAHAMMFTMRGVPVVYAGDEQGFTGDGGDQDAREDQFPSKVASYNDNALVGTTATTAQENFDSTHLLYREIAQLSNVRRAYSALRRGRQIVRNTADQPGLLAISRIDPETAQEVVIAFNTSSQSLEASVEVGTAITALTQVMGACPAVVSTPGQLKVSLAPLDFMICASGEAS